MNTKEKILASALELFSQRGYSSVSVRDLAAHVGVRESAMYRHFRNKQAVFDQLLDNYMHASDQFMATISANPSAEGFDMSKSAQLYSQLSDASFIEVGESVFREFLMLPDIRKFWKMISIERLSNEKLALFWKEQLFDLPIAFQRSLFERLIDLGQLKPYDPEMLAIEFFAPLLMLYIHALGFEPESKEFDSFLSYANRHMAHFRSVYSA
ncbi:MAG: TetR/AcrR family transcriptional regulator [Eubacteriaceae bacterium]|nr:TetR/AcrR family transcriptional regulator [Eubacteriaceae bacterium]